MYLYYDKTRTLKTALAHGEPIRQNSDINIFICLDQDFFENSDLAAKSEVFASITYENGKFGVDGVSSGAPQKLPFKKINSSEITYYLQENKNYWTYHLKIDASQGTVYPGKIYFNVDLSVNGNKLYGFGTAELFVEARTGLPSVDNSITQTEYDNLIMRLNKLTNRVTIIEQTGGGGGTSNKLTDLTGSKWKFNEKIDFNEFLVSKDEYYFYINFTSDGVNFNSIIFNKRVDIFGYNILNYYSDVDGILSCYYDNNGDGIPGWESPFGIWQTINIQSGQDIKNTALIDWLYENATLISGGSSSGGSDLILDDYYDKTQSDEIFATKQELLEQINKILGGSNIETLDSIKELAAAIGNNPNFSKEILELINQKQESGDFTALSSKVETLEDNLEQNKDKIQRLESDVPKISSGLQSLQNDFDNVSVVTATQITTMFNKNK